ncbi:MAG: hypothetical protein WD154_08040 [Nitrosopumilaceae archaeon]
MTGITKLPDWMRLDKDIKMLDKIKKHLVLRMEKTDDPKLITRCNKTIVQLEKTIMKLKRTWERMKNS